MLNEKSNKDETSPPIYDYKIVPDNDPPAMDVDNFFFKLSYCSSRYLLGDELQTQDWITEKVASVGKKGSDTDELVLPYYAYIHSGMKLSTSPFGCSYDSGQCGIAIASKKNLSENFPDCKDIEEKARELLSIELDMRTCHLNGDLHGYILFRDGEEVDSCYGYYRHSDAKQDAVDAIALLIKEASETPTQPVGTVETNSLPTLATEIPNENHIALNAADVIIIEENGTSVSNSACKDRLPSNANTMPMDSVSSPTQATQESQRSHR